MTVRHIVVLRWKDDITDADLLAIDVALGQLPAVIPSLRSYHHGRDLGLGEGRWDYGIVAECDDEAGWEAYDRHPAHQHVVVDVLRPHIAERAAVQISTD
jgi:hypothetical protein